MDHGVLSLDQKPFEVMTSDNALAESARDDLLDGLSTVEDDEGQ